MRENQRLITDRMRCEPKGDGTITVTVTGFLVDDLPDLKTATLGELREVEWSGLIPCKSGIGAWMTCQCCGAVKIDGKGHKPGCVMAEAIAARAKPGTGTGEA